MMCRELIFSIQTDDSLQTITIIDIQSNAWTFLTTLENLVTTLYNTLQKMTTLDHT
jgi:hypothetical protein